jgi:hypothetical protein
MQTSPRSTAQEPPSYRIVRPFVHETGCETDVDGAAAEREAVSDCKRPKIVRRLFPPRCSKAHRLSEDFDRPIARIASQRIARKRNRYGNHSFETDLAKVNVKGLGRLREGLFVVDHGYQLHWPICAIAARQGLWDGQVPSDGEAVDPRGPQDGSRDRGRR